MRKREHIYLVGWVRKSARHRLGEQLEQLRAAGVEKIYGVERGETTADVARHISGRSALVVVTTLARLGSNRNEVAAAVAAIHERGSAVMELSTGRRTDDCAVAVQMAIDAANEISRDHNAFTSESARAGQEASVAARLAKRPKRTSLARARAIWRNTVDFDTEAKALAHPDMAGWTSREAHREFKRRWKPGQGRGGRPRKLKPENE